ncbi:MAG: glycogen synthase GlgA [Gammaproteobacteria bacterium]|nr:MAG: glycogen synthase GlgA [Gammaproteobacteria bacterium]
MDILFAASEAHPLVKTGGLADVAGSLPRAIKNSQQDIRLVLPAYPAAIANAGKLKPVANLKLPGASVPVRLLQGWLPHTRVRLYLVDAPEYFDRPGGPYSSPQGSDWPDNADRFALFARAVCSVATNRAGLEWQPEIVHCNDWQTGLVPALLSLEKVRPATLFTVHNLAYQGLFDRYRFQALQLPDHWWSMEKLEFHQQMSFIKGGLVFSDRITTVSPAYAQEIRTLEFGCGLEGLLEHRKDSLSGILNGVDYQVWSPGRDSLLPYTYTAHQPTAKLKNKRALQKAFGLPVEPGLPLFGYVGRLVEQKGIDLILQLVPELLQRPMQLVILGTGQQDLEEALRQVHRAYPERIGVHIDYNETLAHLLEAGSDIFLMPSRFEPCGLNQLYSLRYGTPPIVRNTGGLADSVIDATDANLSRHTATGFVFENAESHKLLQAIDSALALYARPDAWKDLMLTGMREDFSWTRSAAAYIDLYARLLDP